MPGLLEIISDLSKEGTVLDFILLCETWLHNDNDSLIQIDGYTCITKHRESRPGGGLAIYVNNKHNAVVVENLSKSIPHVFESIFVRVCINKRNLLVGEIYRIPNSNEKHFIDSVSTILSECKNTPIIIGADQNLDLMKNAVHHPTSRFLDKILENDLIPLITKPTRITHRSYSLIDNIYVSANLLVNVKPSILIDYTSDHFPCLAQMVCPFGTLSKGKTISTRKLNDKKIFNINNDLLHKNWLDLMSPDNDLNVNCSLLVSNIQKSLDKFAPIRTKTIRPENVLRLPWMSVNLLKCSKKAKHLFRKSIGKPSSSKETLKFREYRNCLNKLKQIAKKEFITKEIESFKGDTKRIWKMINHLSGKHNDKSNMISELVIDGTKIADSAEICNNLNEHFAKAGEHVTKDCSKDENSHKQYLRKRVTDKLLLSPSNETEILNVLESLPNKTSSGKDGINNVLLKQLKITLRLPLLLIVNQSMMLGQFPDDLKVARIIALHKGGLKSQMDNYRPISLLSVISKVLEKIVNKRLVAFLEKNKILNDRQFGFRKNHSTIHAVQRLVGEIVNGFENGLNCVAIFIDIKMF